MIINGPPQNPYVIDFNTAASIAALFIAGIITLLVTLTYQVAKRNAGLESAQKQLEDTKNETQAARSQLLDALTKIDFLKKRVDELDAIANMNPDSRFAREEIELNKRSKPNP